MFEQVRNQVRAQFEKLSKTTLYAVTVDRDKIWQVYLDAFAPEYRQSNTCNCCKSFLRQYGGIVAISPDYQVATLWDIEVEDPEYAAPVAAVRDYIRSLPISGIFLNSFAKAGTYENFDLKRSVKWNHYSVELPRAVVKREAEIGPLVGAATANKEVLQRSINEITGDAVDTVLELIDQGSLYRGNEYQRQVEELRKLKIVHGRVSAALRSNFCWVQSVAQGPVVSRIRNSAIGTLLVDLSEGRELDSAVSAYERVVAPTNYKRPTALVTPRMVEEARKELETLGLVGALNRRQLSTRDLSVTNALFVYRPAKSIDDVFDTIKKEAAVHPKSLAKVEEVSIGDFLTKVVPAARSVRVLLENQHLANLVTLVGPETCWDASRPLFKWGNDFSWSYTGEVADSIKERVKAAGGNVTGVIRVSLSWHNHDDLDLHVVEPDGEIFFCNKRGTSGGVLDVDMNAGCGTTREPVENIFWTHYPTQEGRFQVVVHQYSKRENTGVGYEIEIEHNGQTWNYAFPSNPTAREHVVDFTYSKRDGFNLLSTQGESVGNYVSKEKWGVKTGQFHQVSAITLSPNRWAGQTGNKHVFFFLEGCRADDKIRPFYNEFLHDDLAKHRKVFEVLGGKILVEPASSGELSGVGFSDTRRDHIYAEVHGAFKRTIKVTF